MASHIRRRHRRRVNIIDTRIAWFGLGLAYLSPWPNAGASATTFTIAAGLWLIIVQWLSSGLGGFITGRTAHEMGSNSYARSVLS
jgi:hypothetical protein